MANHNFKFKKETSDNEYHDLLEKNVELLKELPIQQTEEEILALATTAVNKWFESQNKIDSIAEEIDIPNEYGDIWLICAHYDNDFSSYFDDANLKIAKDFVQCLKDAIRTVALHKVHGLLLEDLSSSLVRQIHHDLERSYKMLINDEHYIQTMRYSCALNSAIRDCNNNGFKYTFERILNYFDNLKAKVFINQKESALAYLSEIKLESNVNEVTENNFNLIWWNGEVSIIHVKNGEIITNFFQETLND